MTSELLPRTLLVTSTRPGIGTVGEVFLSAFVKNFSQGQLACFAGVSVYDIPVLDPDLSWLNIVAMPLPEEYPVLCEQPDERYSKEFLLGLRQNLEPHIVAAVELGRKINAEVIWGVLNSPSMILMMKEVAKRLALPLAVLVWDPISSVVRQRRMNDHYIDILTKEFDSVISESASWAVSSTQMQDQYKAKYSVQSEVLIFSPKALELTASLPAKASDNLSFDIGFAGALYATDEFAKLLEALTQLKWVLHGKHVSLKVFSNQMPQMSVSGRGCNVQFFGHRAVDEVVSLLSTCDLAYLPYWFDPQYLHAVANCFPNKMTAYMAAGLPTLYHGPDFSVPHALIEKFDIGINCSSSKVEDLISTLNGAQTTSQYLRIMRSKVGHFYGTNYAPHIFAASFSRFINRAKKHSKLVSASV